MTTTYLLPEKTPATSEMTSPDPPTYAESFASESSHIKPILSRQSSSLSQRPAEPTPGQFLRGDKKGPGRIRQGVHAVTSRVGWPLNKAANVIGAEGWWPTSMEKECNKAARILHSFTCQ